MENNPDLFIEINKDGFIDFTLGAAKIITGTKESELIGKSWLDIFDESDRPSLKAMKTQAKPAQRCGPVLVTLKNAVSNNPKAIMTGISMPGSSKDKTIIRVSVEEKSTGEISLGAGFSSQDGPLANIGIRERNLLGKGQDLTFNFKGSAARQEFKIGFTEPYFLDRDVSAGFDLVQSTTDRQTESSFDERKAGGGLRLGYSLGPDLNQ